MCGGRPVVAHTLFLACVLMIDMHRFLFLLLACLLANDATANGWEHGAVPYDALVKALDFPDAETRLRAAHSLGVRGRARAVQPLLQRLESPEPNVRVRSAIYIAFGHLKTAASVPALHNCLEKEQREELRADCARALGLIADPRSLALLLAALEKNSTAVARLSVVEALGGFAHPDVIAVLSEVLRGDAARLRLVAALALGRTGSTDAVEPLLKAFNSASNDTELAAIAHAFGELGASEAAEPLAALLSTTKNPALRARVVIVLGVIRNGSSFPTLVEMLEDPTPTVRFFAVNSLRELGQAQAVEPLARLSLSLAGRLAARPVAEMLSNPAESLADLGLQEAIVRTLVELGPGQSLQVLLAAARARDVPAGSSTGLKLLEAFYQQRRAALYGLGYTQSPTAMRALREVVLGDPDFRLRALAVRSIGVLGFGESASLAGKMLSDSSPEVRWTAASVLGRLHDHTSEAPLRVALGDEHAQVRKQAALGLGYLHATSAIGDLKALANKDSSEQVRKAAAYAISLLVR